MWSRFDLTDRQGTPKKLFLVKMSQSSPKVWHEWSMHAQYDVSISGLKDTMKDKGGNRQTDRT